MTERPAWLGITGDAWWRGKRVPEMRYINETLRPEVRSLVPTSLTPEQFEQVLELVYEHRQKVPRFVQTRHLVRQMVEKVLQQPQQQSL